MINPEVTYREGSWVCSDGSILYLDADVVAHVSDMQVTLVDAFRTDGGRVYYWQRTALIDWVACHQHQLRALHAEANNAPAA